MKNGSILKNILGVAISNISTIISGILVGFILPKMLSVEGYGFYKTFTLYTSYLGLLSLGMIDGIVLRYGGVDYDNLDKPLFRGYFKWSLLIYLFFAIVIAMVSVLFCNGEVKYILFSIAFFMIISNMTAYFQQISQITQRFREYSLRKILLSTFNVVIVLILYLIYKRLGMIDYKLYMLSWIFMNLVLSVWYVFTYRDIVFGKGYSILSIGKDVLKLIQNGFPLLFANICATLILTLDRQFVNVLFDTKTYAIYAFAYNMLSLVTVATSAISTVLYPAMKRTDEKNLSDSYSLLLSVLLIFVFGAVSAYFPLSVFIKWYLPKYEESLVIFRIIFPGLAISSAITVVIHNYYKVFNASMEYFKKSVFVLVISGFANYFAYKVFKTTVSISIASIVTMIFWYLFAEQFFVIKYKCKRWNNFLYIIFLLICFYSLSSILNEYIGFVLYLVCFSVITLLMFGKSLKNMKNMLV